MDGRRSAIPPARHRRMPNRTALRRPGTRRRTAREPPGRQPGTQGAQGRGPRDGACCRHPADLPPEQHRRRGSAGPARHLLEPCAGQLRRSRGTTPQRTTLTGVAMTQTAAAVVHKQIVVQAPVDKAFAVFTERFGDFKPPEHNLLTVPIAETVFEPRVGGHIYDRGTDGSECRWARVLAFDPPRRVVFSWDIGPTWQLETEPENASAVEVRFIAETPDRTRVELEHRNIDRHGPGWEAVAKGVGNDQGWPLYLARYAALFGEGS